MRRKQTLNINGSWSYAMKCRHCGWRQVYVVDKAHMNYRTFYRQVSEQLVRIGFCPGCEERGVHDLVAICQEKYETREGNARNVSTAEEITQPPRELAETDVPDSESHLLPVGGNGKAEVSEQTEN